MTSADDDTSPETPESKRRFTLNQGIALVSLLKNILHRLSLLDRSQAYLISRTDRTSPEVLTGRRIEAQEESNQQLKDFMDTLAEDEIVDRPSQSIIVNVNGPKRTHISSLRPDALVQRTVKIVLLVAAITSGIIIALVQSGILK